MEKGSSIFQFALPQQYRLQAIRGCRDNIEHLGIERTSGLIKDRFFWPSLIKDVSTPKAIEK